MPSAGVEELFGEDAVVPLDTPVVPGRVWRDALVSNLANRVVERVAAVARTVVGHDPLDLSDAMSGKPAECSVEKRDCRGGFLLGQRFGVRQPRVTVDGGVEEDVPVFAPRVFVRATALASSLPLPCTRQPPPSGMRPVFFTSRWTMLPGRAAMISCGSRLVSPFG